MSPLKLTPEALECVAELHTGGARQWEISYRLHISIPTVRKALRVLGLYEAKPVAPIGTRRKHVNGYMEIRTDIGWDYEHRVVMREHLGRALGSDEHVHHINEDRSDNRIENLEVLNEAEHARRHVGRVLNKTRRASVVALSELGFGVRRIAQILSCDSSTITRHLQAHAGNPRPRYQKAGL